MNAIKHRSHRAVRMPVDAPETREVRFATDKAVQKARKRAIEKFATMFRKLAQQ